MCSASFRTPLAAVMAVLVMACDSPVPTAPVTNSRSALAASHTTPLRWLEAYLGGSAPAASDAPAVLAGAGDIARCYPGPNFRQYRPPGPDHPAERTAQLLDRMPGATVMAAGDNAYEFGSPLDYLGCYHPTWGRHLRRTRPAAGNHEYLTPGAAGYFIYYRQRSAPPLGYYSYDLGRWHVVVVNSTPQVYLCYPQESDERLPGFPALPVPPDPGPVVGRLCAGDVAQQAWLAADLAANRDAECTLVYFHHPRFSSGKHGNHYQMQKIWDIMYANGVDVVISAHDHLYERFAPQDPDGNADPEYGIRQFTVGTGGADFYALRERQPNSEVLITGSHGVIALALDDGRYAWAFVNVDRAIEDSGEGSCHGAPA